MLPANDFSLVSNVLYLSGTYGVTDNLDLNVLLPLIWTPLDLKGRATAAVIGGPSVGDQPEFNGSAFGPGDILVRAKYRFVDDLLKVASLVALRLPTGSEGDFHGLGDTTLLAGLVTSKVLGLVDLHGSMG